MKNDTRKNLSVLSKLRTKLSPKRNQVEERAPHDGDDNYVLSIHVHVQKCNQFQQVFQHFDEDGDGKISPSELQICLTSLGTELSSAEAVSVVESLDSDQDGFLGLEDFEKLMQTNGEEEKMKDLRVAFGMYQMDGSGCITPKSLKKMLSLLGDHKSVNQCKAIISGFDLDGDGVISFDEFQVMMR